MSLIIITRRNEITSYIQKQKKLNPALRIGFVPTMGALHGGHGSLLKKSSLENDLTVLSIFVNPKQFGPQEDLSKYPRQFKQDCEIALSYGAQVVFAPTVEEMYPQGFSTQISVSKITNFMCGKVRPGHFEGVATVVMLLLNLTQADTAYFGQKDFQQVHVVKRMCLDLACAAKISMEETIREPDGLAMSSRNVYLSPEARKIASLVPQALASVAKKYLSGERASQKLIADAAEILKTKNLTPQYLEIRKTEDLSQQVYEQITEESVLTIAQMIPSAERPVRLIDNIILSEDSRWICVLEELIKNVQVSGNQLQ